MLLAFFCAVSIKPTMRGSQSRLRCPGLMSLSKCPIASLQPHVPKRPQRQTIAAMPHFLSLNEASTRSRRQHEHSNCSRHANEFQSHFRAFPHRSSKYISNEPSTTRHSTGMLHPRPRFVTFPPNRYNRSCNMLAEADRRTLRNGEMHLSTKFYHNALVFEHPGLSRHAEDQETQHTV